MIWLSPRRLDWALRARGTDLSTWPANERAAALTLMRHCSKARAVMAAALAHDDYREAAPVDPALLNCLLGRLRQRMVARPVRAPAIRWGAMAACAMAGLYLGMARVDSAPPDLFAAVQAFAIDAAL